MYHVMQSHYTKRRQFGALQSKDNDIDLFNYPTPVDNDIPTRNVAAVIYSELK